MTPDPTPLDRSSQHATTATSRPPTPTRTFRLRAGVPVQPRGDGLVQVGSDPARRVLLPDTASVRSLLQALPLGVRPESSPIAPEVLRALDHAGLLVDEDERRLLAEARSATRVRVGAPPWWEAVVRDLVSAAGLTAYEVTTRTTPSAAEVTARAAAPDVTLVLTWGEPDRAGLDLLTAADEPWLPVAVLEGRVRVGPFVVPGSSACLRCVDAHAAAEDPWHRVPPPPEPPVAAAPGNDAPEPADAVEPLLLRHGLLTAVTDLARWAEGRQPLTWSATRTHRDPLTVEHQVWSRHPYCGCAWGDDVATG